MSSSKRTQRRSSNAIVWGRADKRELVDRFADVGSRVYAAVALPHAPSAEATRAQLRADNPTAARCDTTLFVDADNRARVAAIANPRLVDDAGVPVGLLGLFESVDDADAAGAVLDRACRYLRDRGCAAIRGPINYTTWHSYRFAVAEPNADGGWIPGEPVHPPYYPGLWDRAGFAVAARYRSTWMGDGDDLLARFAPAAARATNAGVQIRPLDNAADLAAVYQVSRRAFADAFMYSDIDATELAALYPPDKVAGPHSGVYLATCATAGAVGFLYTTPGQFPGRARVSVAKTIAVTPDWRGRGVYKALLHRWIGDRLAAGPCDFVAALMHHDGEPAKMGWTAHHVIREYALYERCL